MESNPNNLPANAIHYYSNGFSFIKRQSADSFVCANHKNASFPTLERECGIFFAELPLDSEITVYVDAATPLVVPAEIDSPAVNLLKLQHELSDNDTVLEDAIGPYRLLFPYPIHKIAQLQKAVGHNIALHHTDTFITQFLQGTETHKEYQLGIRLESEKSELILLKNKELQIITPNRYTTLEDVLYYVLNLLQQFEIPLADCDFHYMGTTGDEKKTEKFFKTYLPGVQSVL